ncbi:MAG: CRISPR-associated RAMP protein [Sandaracinaceae bacterium]|nr:CRISPR-associated RAMP protein [Sandaracinaceae bacterium]
MSDPFFHVFRHRTRVRGVIECVSALRIGVGRSSDALGTDLPILRDARGVPVIPGASIKGVVRSQVEALLRAMNQSWAGDPFEQGGSDEERARAGEGSAAKKAKEVRDDIAKNADEASRIFGRPNLASHVRFADAYPVPGQEIAVEVRDGVAIDRDLGRVSGAKKYDFEVVAAGSRFTLELMMDGLEERQEGAVVAGLEMLNEGFARLGGFKSRGLGLVKLVDLEVSGLRGPTLERFEHTWDEFHGSRLAAFRRWAGEATKGAA